MDEWKLVWDWAQSVWGPATAQDLIDYYGEAARFGKDFVAKLGFNRFFQYIAGEAARAEGWEECGSSDVWHASYYAVKQLKDSGKIKTRRDLVDGVCDYTGYGHGQRQLYY